MYSFEDDVELYKTYMKNVYNIYIYILIANLKSPTRVLTFSKDLVNFYGV